MYRFKQIVAFHTTIYICIIQRAVCVLCEWELGGRNCIEVGGEHEMK